MTFCVPHMCFLFSTLNCFFKKHEVVQVTTDSGILCNCETKLLVQVTPWRGYLDHKGFFKKSGAIRGVLCVNLESHRVRSLTELITEKMAVVVICPGMPLRQNHKVVQVTPDYGTSNRHHPMIIRFCLSLASKSASPYDELRPSNVLTLPSRRT